MKRFLAFSMLPASLLTLLPLLFYKMNLPLSPALVSLCLTYLAPLGCFLLPMPGSMKGLSPYLAFLPPFVFALLPALLLRLSPGDWVPLICFLLSVLSASIGREVYLRNTKK